MVLGVWSGIVVSFVGGFIVVCGSGVSSGSSGEVVAGEGDFFLAGGFLDEEEGLVVVVEAEGDGDVDVELGEVDIG
jgi:hypothetical protein